MPETTENYHRIPVSSGHADHEIKTITVSSEEGIKALYCVDCKEIITYLFDVDKWTMAEAEEWVDEHKDSSLSAVSRINKGTRDSIGSFVRYKSHGQFVQKSADKDTDGDELLVRGFFTNDIQDEVGDIITKEATVAAIKKWRRWGNIRTMHEYPSGRVEKIGEEDGLAWNEIVTKPVDKQTIDLIRGGVLKAYSVGIIPRRYDINEDADDGTSFFPPLIIHEYDMVEISYVDHPANYGATIEDVTKAAGNEFKHRSVVYKRLNLEEDDTMREDKEINDAELEDAEEVVKKDVDEVVDEENGTDESDTQEEQVVEKSGDEHGAADVENVSNSEQLAEEEVSEKEINEPEKDDSNSVADDNKLAELSALIDKLNERVDAIESLVVDISEKMLKDEHEVSAEDDPNEEDVSKEADEEPSQYDESDSVVKALNEIKEEIIKGVVSALNSDESRTAKVLGEQEEEVEKDADEVEYRFDRKSIRRKMKDVINKQYGER